jgi:hypothetical protein
MSSKKVKQKYLLFWTLTAILAVGVIELASLILLVIFDSPRLTYSEIYQDLVQPAAKWNKEWQVSRVTHPYFGFVYDPNSAGINNMGFLDQRPFPYRKNPGQLTVAFFGGSVAALLFKDKNAHNILVEAVRNSRREFANYEIVFLNFALGGEKQPQQYFIFSYFLESIDIAINLDGWNEIYVETPKNFPSDFPEGSEFYFQNNTRYLATLGQIDALRTAVYHLGRLPLRLPSLVLSHSYYLTWKTLRNLAQKWETTALHLVGRGENTGYGPSIRSSKSPNPESTNLEMVNNWKKYTQLQSQLAESRGMTSLFFIQPNQYFEGTKKFSEEEKRNAFRDSPPPYNERHRLLVRAASDLRKKGVRIHSAEKAFSSINETVYIDNCCHINSVGNVALANFMASVIKESLIRLPAGSNLSN